MTEFLTSISERLASYFNPLLLGNRFAELLANLVTAVVILLTFYIAWRFLAAVLKPVFKRSNLDATSTTFVQTIVKYVILTFGVAHALNAIGIDAAALVASLGIAGLTIGFAARDALSNIISGLFIFWDRPFVIGDLIEVEDSYGRVDAITLRSTRVVTVDGKMLAIPNSTMVNSTVASYTNFPHLRLDLAVTIGVDQDIDKARRILAGLVTDNPTFMPEPAPRVVVTELNDYNIGLQLQAWIHDERGHVAMRFALRESVYRALQEGGIDMPFETLQLQPLEVTQRSAAA